MSRHLAREAAFQAIFSVDAGQFDSSKVLELFAEVISSKPDISSCDLSYARRLVSGVLEQIDNLDPIIQEFSIDWNVERLAWVDRAILRLALYELFFTDTPVRVVANEAVILAKTFGTGDSSRFVNGILGSIVKNREDIKARFSKV